MSYEALLQTRRELEAATANLVKAEVEFLLGQGWEHSWDHVTDTVSWIDPGTKVRTPRKTALEFAVNDYTRELHIRSK